MDEDDGEAAEGGEKKKKSPEQAVATIIAEPTSTLPAKKFKSNPRVFFEIRIGKRDVGRVVIELRADVVFFYVSL